MKILIITFTGGMNPGTFMQALGVQTALLKIYPEAQIDFLKFPDFKKGNLMVRGKSDTLWNIFLQKSSAVFRLVKYHKLRKQNFNYTKPIDLFNYDKNEIKFINDYDLVVIGSDTILEQAYNDSQEIGLNWFPLNTPKLYFSASASPANFTPTKDLKKTASKALFIGLRDDLTINYFNKQLEIPLNKIVKQPDPSFFLNLNKFQLSNKLASKIRPNQKYALYNFNSNFPYRKDIADNLRILGYKVVSTAYNPYADICFDTIDANEWAGVFPLMDIIVTERFHDSVFALRNCKPVIAIDWEKHRISCNGDSKTYRILEDYGLKHLHFNLLNSSNLTSVYKTIQNIDSLFDPIHITKFNKKHEQRAFEILELVKQSISL